MNTAWDGLFDRFTHGGPCSLRVEPVPTNGAFALDELAGSERERLLTFASAERRRQFVLGRLAVRRLLSVVQKVWPSEVRVEVGNDGAPRVEGGYVSIAHGGRGFGALGLAAFAHQPVGVDVEVIRPRHPRLADRILLPDEVSVFDGLGRESTSALPLIWSLKEAVLKGQRTGLRAGARSVHLQEIDVEASTARAVSEVSGTWTLNFERSGDLWLAVAVQDPATGGR